jgi:hypothetical protein
LLKLASAVGLATAGQGGGCLKSCVLQGMAQNVLCDSDRRFGQHQFMIAGYGDEIKATLRQAVPAKVVPVQPKQGTPPRAGA